MLNELLPEDLVDTRAIIFIAVSAIALLGLYRRWRASRELRLPFLKFEDGDDSRQRYVTESTKLLKLGYEKVTPKKRHQHKFDKRLVLMALHVQNYTNYSI